MNSRPTVRSETEAASGHLESLAAPEHASDEQLAEILDGYMSALEKDGIPPDLDELAADHPELGDQIRAYGESLQLLHRAVSRFGPDRSTGQNDSPPGVKRLGDFEIVRQIGRGGMGVVYEARQISLNRPVALKILPFAAMLDERQIARFRTEAQAAAALHHPNIVPVYAIGQERGVHFFAMQFVDGQPLDCAINELRSGNAQWCEVASSPPSQSSKETVVDQVPATKVSSDSRRYCRSVARLAAQAARALHHAHEFGIIHRDVKPSNLLLDRNGKLWVTDFGLARIQSESGVTVSGDVVGTLRYMSPEQAAGSNALVDARTDVYSLGATLYELLTLRHIHEAEDRQELLRQIATREPLSPRKVNPGISGDLEAIVLCAMARLREDRYETAQAMADDLERYLAGQSIVARRPSLLDRATRWALRHRRAAALAAGLLLVFSLLCVTGTWLIAREKHRTEAALAVAEQNLGRAEEHFRLARQVVDQFGNRLAGQLAALPGSEPVRRQLLLETLQYYREFISHAADDPQLQNELATTYCEAGSIAQQLGDRQAAQDDFQQALMVFRNLAELSPEDAESRIDQARCLNNLALVLAANGDFETARLRYGEAVELLEPLLDVPQQDPRFVRALAETCGNLGLMYAQQGQHQPAREALARAIDQLKQLDGGNTARERDRHGLAICYNNLSYVERDVDASVAAQSCGEAIAILSELVDQDPQSLDLRSDLALFHNNLGAIQGRLELWELACTSYNEAIALQRQLVRQAPHIVGYRYALTTSLTNVGQALSASGHLPEATKAFDESRQLAMELADDFPAEGQFRSLLGGVLNNLAMVEEQSGQLDVAMADYAAAVTHQREAFESAPDVSDYREFLSKHYFNYGRALRATGRPAEAGEAALARRQLWPGDGPHLYEIAVELAQAAAQLTRHGQTPEETALGGRLAGEARTTLQEAAEAGHDLVEANRRMADRGLQLPDDWQNMLAEAAAAQGPGVPESVEAGEP